MGGFFRFSERGTNLRTEVIAGLTTFMTMAYIIFVNPNILGTPGTGLSIPGVFFATCIAAAAASIVGFLAIFNGAGRIVWAAASDRVGRMPAFVAMLALQGVCLLLLPHASIGPPCDSRSERAGRPSTNVLWTICSACPS